MEELIRNQIEKLKNVGQHAFNGSDYSFGFQTWKAGTLTLLKRILPQEIEVYKQVQSINVYRVSTKAVDASAYNLEACKDQAREILQILIETINRNKPNNGVTIDFWQLLYPRVRLLAQNRFENNHFADSVSVCLREINSIVKGCVKEAINLELDGAPLMTRAFSPNNPIIQFADITTENGRNIQLGYMKIFGGAMIGIRNPKAHENLNPDQSKTIHLLFIASFMFLKLQEAGVINEE